MTVTLTYDSALSRVRVTATGLGANVDVALVERSTDQIRWTTVRGGTAAPAPGGVLSTSVDDYEFVTGTVNYYRVSGIDTAPISFVAAGAAATGDNVSLNPALPAGLAEHDLLLVEASIRNSGTGTPNTPAGYTLLVDAANLCLFGKRASVSESAPTVSFTGGASGADTLARTAAFRNADLSPAITPVTQLNASAQDVARPALTITEDALLALRVAWKQDDWTSITAGPVGWSLIGDAVSTAGSDAAQSWSYRVQATAESEPAGTYTVTGGAAAISRAGITAFRPLPYLTRQTGSITPTLTTVWLKFIARPFLNRVITLGDWGDIERASRSAVFEVVGRREPIGVTETHGSRRVTITAIAATQGEADALDLATSLGDAVFLHTPADCGVPTLYAVLGDTTISRKSRRTDRRVFELPLIEVSAPGPDVVGASGTWNTVLNNYATWQVVLSTFATWQEVAELVGSVNDVIVGD